MGTAPKKSRAAGQLARPARDGPVPESMEFLIFEEDGGAYHERGSFTREAVARWPDRR